MTKTVTPEAEVTRLRRLRIRSWRRGTKEMDLILGGFADDTLEQLSDEDLATYEAILAENDQDLYRWVTAQDAPPDAFDAMISRIASHAGAV